MREFGSEILFYLVLCFFFQRSLKEVNILFLTDLACKVGWFSVAQTVSEQSGARVLFQSSSVNSCSNCTVITNKGLFSNFAFLSKIFTCPKVCHNDCDTTCDMTSVLQKIFQEGNSICSLLKKANPISQTKSWPSWRQLWHLLQYS